MNLSPASADRRMQLGSVMCSGLVGEDLLHDITRRIIALPLMAVGQNLPILAWIASEDCADFAAGRRYLSTACPTTLSDDLSNRSLDDLSARDPSVAAASFDSLWRSTND